VVKAGSGAALANGPIGVFGGSFDPPHMGHVELVRAALETLGLYEVWILPAGTPVHRRLSGKADGEMRRRWLECVFAGENRIKVLDWEVRTDKPTPTITSLKQLRSRYPGIWAVLLLGEDACAGIQEWIGYPAHCQWTDIAVFTRAGCSGLCSEFPEWRKIDIEEWRRTPGCGRQLWVDVQLPDLSATRIRHRAARGISLHGIVPEKIRHEIEMAYKEKPE